MKDLYAIPRLSPFAAFAILTAIAVCLVGVSGAEDRPSYKQSKWDRPETEDDANRQSIESKSISTSQENLNAGKDELWQPNYMAASFFRNAQPEIGGIRRVLKRSSEDLSDESEEEEDESDADGYGYDDDEYYHLNYKRNDDATAGKDAKEAMQDDSNKKEAFQSAKYNFGQKPMMPNDKDKETQTVEMLSFKETHQTMGGDDNSAKSNIAKPMSQPSSAHKKSPNQPVSSLNMNDLKENSAIDEKMKDRKDESSRLSSSSVTGDQKAESKKSAKVNEENETIKLKDSKYGDDSEKKDKEASIKEAKESVASKTIKEDKDKLEGNELKSGAKAVENTKLEDNIEKISSKSKDGYSSKITGDDSESVKLAGKMNSEAVNSNEISQINNRASFVSNDFKGNGNSLKTQGIDEDEKDSEEMNEKNVGLSDYEDETREKDSLRDDETPSNFEYRTNEGDSVVEVQQDNSKKNEYITIPIAFHVKEDNLNDLYKGGTTWREYSRAQEPQDQPGNLAFGRQKPMPLQLALPQSELENTDYHKNYLKSLKKYKGLEEHSKILPPLTNSNSNADETNNDSAKTKTKKKRKRSKITKRKSTNNENMNDIQQRMNAVNAVNNNQMKNIYNQLNSMQLFQQQLQQMQMQQPPRPLNYGSKTQNGMNYMMNGYSANRETRRSPGKVEYEIKIINQNQQDDNRDVPLFKTSSRRKKKSVGTKSNDRFAEKFIKQYPYSQVSRDDLTKLDDSRTGLSDRKFKRKAPAWQSRDQLEYARQVEESSSKNKGAPSGYYSNRVKFGQKHYVPKEGQSGGADLTGNSRISSFTNKKLPADMDKNFLQRSWRDSKFHETRHDAIKRFDDNSIFGKNQQNSLLLVKKDRNGERVAKTFSDANSKSEVDADMNSDQLAKILSKDNDYIVLKKTDKSKFQKVEDGQARSSNDGGPTLNQKYDIFGLSKLDGMRESNKANRGLFIRSYRSNDQKLHNQGAKSSLKKTFEKFKDFADFFKDSEQESTDNQQPAQPEVKETSEIVFSEDKIPDPIVINQDLDSSSNMKTKQNSMSSISNNFKQSDQEKKTTDVMKFEDNSKEMSFPKEVSEKSNWEPALKNMFPEAKSINSMQKNGNEIIVLDFDRNHLKTDQGNKVVLSKPLREQPLFDTGTERLYLPFGSVQKTPNNPLNVAGNRQVDVVLREGSLPNFLEPTSPINKNVASNLAGNLGGSLAGNMANNMGSNLANTFGSNLANPLGNNLANPLSGNLANTLGSNLANPLASNLANPLANNMANPLANNMANPLANNMGSNMANTLGSNLANPLANNLANPFGNNLGNNLGANMGNNMGGNLANTLGGNLANNLGNNLANTLGSNLANTLSNNFANNMGMNLANSLSKQNKFNGLSQPNMNMNGPNNQPVMTLPFSQLSQLPYFLKQNNDKKLNSYEGNRKSTSKKSLESVPLSENFNRFLRDYRELSELNKESSLPKKAKLTKKRSSNEYTLLPPSSFPEFSSYDAENIKDLSNILKALMNNENVKETTVGSQFGMSKNSESPLQQQTQQKWQSNAMEPDMNTINVPQGQWMSASEPQRPFASQRENGDNFILGRMNDDIDSFLGNDEIQEGTNEKDYQNELLEELSAASSKIQRLRRQGVAENKLRKIMEDALPFREKCLSEIGSSTNTKLATGNDLEEVDDSDSNSSVDNYGTDEEDEKKEKTKRSLTNSEKLTELSGSTDDSNRGDLGINLKSSSELLERNWRNRRRIRSPASDFKTKVSKSEVENKILKKLEEDTDQSVYSPGIKRKLLSIDETVEVKDDKETEAEADNLGRSYFNKNEKFQQDPATCVKNANNKCIDPIILDLFRSGDDQESQERQTRTKRSAYEPSHSNYKREIDLDESMPNDFQNFLVTSLGLDSHVTAYGSQRRENKENNQTPARGDEDSLLEKREISNGDNLKRPNHKERSEYFDTGTGAGKLQTNPMQEINQPAMKLKLQEKPGIKSKSPAEYEESKVPTQIRIQITKASAKEKKSSKPAIEDSQTSSNDVEMTSKEKEYFGKNKFGPLHERPNGQKLMSKYKMDKYFMDLGEGDAAEDQKYYLMPRSFRRARRKKKKYIQENPMKPVKDFIAFDQKAMETLIRKYFADQNMQRSQNLQSPQKLPTANHLPQVETVYNPTQGTDKAQVESYKPLAKVNSLSNKNSVSAKNSLQSNEASAYDEGMLRSYMQEKSIHAKNDKQAAKEFEEVDWKSYTRPRPEPSQDNQPEIQNFKPYIPAAPQSLESNDISLMKKNPNNPMRWYQLPNSNYMTGNPSMNLFGASAAGPPTKIKPGGQIWSPQGLSKDDANIMKGWRKFPNYLSGSPYAKESKEKSPNTGMSPVDESWNMLDGYLNKKSLSDKYKIRDSFGGLKENLEDSMKMRYPPYKYYQSIDDEKSNILEPQSSANHALEKESDYSDNLDDEYLDSDDLKQESQFDIDSGGKREGKYEDANRYSNLFGYKNVDLDDVLSDDDDELDEDYDENADDNLDDYSLLSSPNLLQSEITNKINENNNKLRGPYYMEDPLFASAKPKELPIHESNLEESNLRNSKMNERLEPASNQITLAEVKNDVDPFGSSAILKKANENSNILGKNLMKNLNRYNYDENTVKGPEKFMENRIAMRDYRNPEMRPNEKYNKKKLDWQSKLKRSQGMSPIGSRLFYASKMEIPDSKDVASLDDHASQRRNDRNVFYHFPKRNPRNVKLQNAENEFERELKNNHRYFTSSLVNSDDGDGEPGDAKEQETSKHEQENEATDSEDVEENLEDDSENISEDNVLENVIGKYIMRKSVKAKPYQSLRKTEQEEDEKTNTKLRTDESDEKKIRRKRFITEEKTHSSPKIWRKRLSSSGHLTEKNFKKYHTKNLNEMRKSRGMNSNFLRAQEPVLGFDFIEENLNLIPESEDEKERKETSNHQWKETQGKKRSALNLFKKFGSKDRDNKKEDAMNARTVGFEPILSTADSKFELTRPDALVRHGESAPLATANPNKPPVSHSVVGPSRLTDNKKEKSKIESSRNEGPWKIDLNEKLRGKSIESNAKEAKNRLNPAATNSKAQFTSGAPTDDVKAFLVIRKQVRNVEQTENFDSVPSDLFSPAFGTSKREVFLLFSVNSPESRENFYSETGFSSKQRRKRQSVFPLTLNEANKIEDNRHVNEETSEHLGQQIVDAILSKVNKNPRFKKVIEPGLMGKMSKRRDEASYEVLNRDEDYPGQVQNLLQKVVFDIEKIAERHVKKRMCNKIDKKSQEFLHSLLEAPDGSCVDYEKEDEDFDAPATPFLTETSSFRCPKLFSTVRFRTSNAMDEKDDSSTSDPVISTPFPSSDVPDATTPAYTNAGDRVAHFNDKMCETLRKKQNTLKKLIDDYQRLSELEKQTISVSFEYLKTELEQTNQLLSSLNGEKSHPDERCVKEEKEEREKKIDGSEHEKCHLEIREKGFEGETKYEIQNVTSSDASSDKSMTTQKSELRPIVFHFEPSEEDKNSEETENSTAETTTAQPSRHQAVQGSQDIKDQGFESVTDKAEPMQAFDAMPTQAPLRNKGGLKGYSSPVFVRLKTDREKTGRISKEDLSRLGKKTEVEGRDSNYPASYLKSKDPTSDRVNVGLDGLCAIDGGWSVANSKEGPDPLQKERFEDPYDKYPLDELEKNLLVTKKNLRPDSERISTKDGGRALRRKMYRAKRHRDPSDIFHRQKLTECKGFKTEERDTDFEENPGLEYLIWSSMPLVRRRLNNLALGDDIPRIPFQGTKKRK